MQGNCYFKNIKCSCYVANYDKISNNKLIITDVSRTTSINWKNVAGHFFLVSGNEEWGIFILKYFEA